jgi:hypothetical protein
VLLTPHPASPLPVDENQQGPGELVRRWYGAGPCYPRQRSDFSAQPGSAAAIALVFQFSNIVRQARALGQPVLFSPPVHTSSFSAAKTKGTEKRYVYLVSVPLLS